MDSESTKPASAMELTPSFFQPKQKKQRVEAPVAITPMLEEDSDSVINIHDSDDDGDDDSSCFSIDSTSEFDFEGEGVQSFYCIEEEDDDDDELEDSKPVAESVLEDVTNNMASKPTRKQRVPYAPKTMLKSRLSKASDPLSEYQTKTQTLRDRADHLGTPTIKAMIGTVHELLSTFTIMSAAVLDQLDFELRNIRGQRPIVYVVALPGGDRVGETLRGYDRVKKKQNVSDKHGQQVMSLSQCQDFLCRVSSAMGLDSIVETLYELDLPWFWYFPNDIHHDERKRVEIALLLVEGALATYFQCMTKMIYEKFFIVPDQEIWKAFETPNIHKKGYEMLRGITKSHSLRSWATLKSDLRDPSVQTTDEHVRASRLLRDAAPIDEYLTNYLQNKAFGNGHIDHFENALPRAPRRDTLDPILAELTKQLTQYLEEQNPAARRRIERRVKSQVGKIEKGALDEDGKPNDNPYVHPSIEKLGTGAWDKLPRMLQELESSFGFNIEQRTWSSLEKVDPIKLKQYFPDPTPIPVVDDDDLSVVTTLHGQTTMIIPAYYLAYDEISCYVTRLKTLRGLYRCRYVMEQMNMAPSGGADEIRRLAISFLMKIKGPMGKGDGSIRAARNLAFPKGYFTTGAKRNVLLVTRNIGKGVNYQDAIYLYSRLGDDLFALLLQMYGFPNQGITIFHSQYAGCSGVPAVGRYEAIECSDHTSERYMTTVKPNDPDHPYHKNVCCNHCARNLRRPNRVVEWFEVQLASNKQLTPGQNQLYVQSKQELEEHRNHDALLKKENREQMKIDDPEALHKQQYLDTKATKQKARAAAIDDVQAQTVLTEKNRHYNRNQPNERTSLKIFYTCKKTYSPEFLELIKVVVRLAALHGGTKGLQNEAWIKSEELTKILSPMILTAARANRGMIGTWKLKCSPQTNSEDQQTQPKIILGEFEKAVAAAGFRRAARGSPNFVPLEEHRTRWTFDKEHYKQAAEKRFNLKKTDPSDMSRGNHYCAYSKYIRDIAYREFVALAKERTRQGKMPLSLAIVPKEYRN